MLLMNKHLCKNKELQEKDRIGTISRETTGWGAGGGSNQEFKQFKCSEFFPQLCVIVGQRSS